MKIDTYLPKLEINTYYEWERFADWDPAQDKPLYKWEPVMHLSVCTPRENGEPFRVNGIDYRIVYGDLKVRHGHPIGRVVLNLARVTDDWQKRDNVTDAARETIYKEVERIVTWLANDEKTQRHTREWTRASWILRLEERDREAHDKASKVRQQLLAFVNSDDMLPPNDLV